MTDELYKDSEEAGKVFGQKLKLTMTKIIKPISEYVNEWWQEQKDIKAIEKEAFMHEKIKMIQRNAKIKARKQYTNTEQGTDKPILRIMEEDYYGKFN